MGNSPAHSPTRALPPGGGNGRGTMSGYCPLPNAYGLNQGLNGYGLNKPILWSTLVSLTS